MCVIRGLTGDFSSSKTVPDTLFEDKRFNRKSSLRLSGKFIEFENSINEKIVSKKAISFNESMVASQGFDNFIRINFSKLKNESIEFKFGVLENQNFYPLKGYKRSATTSEVEFGIKASSWILGLFSSEIKVKYDSTTKRLKYFSGRSNILDDSGKSQDVTINYQWKTEP